jgi:hypothetical protein
MNEQEQCQNWGDLLGNIVYDMHTLALLSYVPQNSLWKSFITYINIVWLYFIFVIKMAYT